MAVSACSQKGSTSDFLGKEPEYIPTPASVSEEKESSPLISISIDGEPTDTAFKDARISIGINDDDDSIASAKYRKEIIAGALKRAGLPALTEAQMDLVAKTNVFCMPLKDLSKWISMTDAQRAEYLATLNAPTLPESDFDAMIDAMSEIDEIKSDEKKLGLVAGKDTPFNLIKEMFEKLREHGLNKFTLMTALKRNDDRQ